METEYIWDSIVGCPVTNMHAFIQSYRRTESVPGRTLISAPCNHTQKTGRLPLGPLVSTRNEESHQVQSVYSLRESGRFFLSWEVVWKRPGVKHEFLRPNLVKITSLRKDVERASHLLRGAVWSVRFVLLDTQRVRSFNAICGIETLWNVCHVG